MKYLFFLVLFFLTSCDDWHPEIIVVNTLDVGIVVSSEYSQGTFSEWAKTVITTTRGNLIVQGTRSVMIGDSAEIRTYNNGKRYLCLESEANCFYIY